MYWVGRPQSLGRDERGCFFAAVPSTGATTRGTTQSLRAADSPKRRHSLERSRGSFGGNEQLRPQGRTRTRLSGYNCAGTGDVFAPWMSAVIVLSGRCFVPIHLDRVLWVVLDVVANGFLLAANRKTRGPEGRIDAELSRLCSTPSAGQQRDRSGFQHLMLDRPELEVI